MVERGTRIYVQLEDRRLLAEPANGESWTDTFTTSIPIEPGEELYLLTVSYTTGNSFGRDPDTKYECIDVYRDQASAAEQAKVIREHYSRVKSPLRREELDYDETFKVAFKLGSGEDYVCEAPWLDYFARIEEIEVAPVRLGPSAVLKF